MTETMRDVLAEPVEIRGGHPLGEMRGALSGAGPDAYPGGGYTVDLIRYTTGPAVVRLYKHEGYRLMTPSYHTAADFDTHAEARAEFERIRDQLRLRQKIEVVVGSDYLTRHVLPPGFEAHVRAGDLAALLVAADLIEEGPAGDEFGYAMILRAAYYRFTGQPNVAVRVSKKENRVYNAVQTSKRSPLGFRGDVSLYDLMVVTVTAGESVRIVRLDLGHTSTGVTVREFKVGDEAEFDSYNLSYFGKILSVTAKTVVVDKRRNAGETARMSIAAFAERNHDFDPAAARKRNAMHMD